MIRALISLEVILKARFSMMPSVAWQCYHMLDGQPRSSNVWQNVAKVYLSYKRQFFKKHIKFPLELEWEANNYCLNGSSLGLLYNYRFTPNGPRQSKCFWWKLPQVKVWCRQALTCPHLKKGTPQMRSPQNKPVTMATWGSHVVQSEAKQGT